MHKIAHEKGLLGALAALKPRFRLPRVLPTPRFKHSKLRSDANTLNLNLESNDYSDTNKAAELRPAWVTGPPIPPALVHANYRSRILESFSRGFIHHLALHPFSIGPGYCDIRIRAGAPEFANPGGVLHGGAVLSILDVAGGKAAYTVLPPNRMVVTAQMSTNFVKGLKGELGIARAQVVKPGKNVIVVRGDLYAVKEAKGKEWWDGEYDERELEHCATALQTLVVVPGKETWSE